MLFAETTKNELQALVPCGKCRPLIPCSQAHSALYNQLVDKKGEKNVFDEIRIVSAVGHRVLRFHSGHMYCNEGGTFQETACRICSSRIMRPGWPNHWDPVRFC